MKGPSLAHWCSGVTHPFTGTANPSGLAVCAPLPMPGSPSDLGGGAAQPSNQSKKTRGGCRAPAPRERTPSIICKRPRSRFSYGSCLVAYEWVGLVRLVHCQFGTHVCLALSPVGMKAVGIGWKNILTNFVFIFLFGNGKIRSEKRNRICGISESVQFDRKHVDNGRKLVLKNRYNTCNHFK